MGWSQDTLIFVRQRSQTTIHAFFEEEIFFPTISKSVWLDNACLLISIKKIMVYMCCLLISYVIPIIFFKQPIRRHI